MRGNNVRSSLARDRHGASAIEQVLAITLVALVSIGAFTALGDETSERADCVARALAGSSAPCRSNSAVADEVATRGDDDSDGREEGHGGGGLFGRLGSWGDSLRDKASDAASGATHALSDAADVVNDARHAAPEFGIGLGKGLAAASWGTVQGIYDLGKYAVQNPGAIARGIGTAVTDPGNALDAAATMGKAVWQDYRHKASVLVHGSASERGEVVGELSFEAIVAVATGGGAAVAAKGSKLLGVIAKRGKHGDDDEPSPGLCFATGTLVLTVRGEMPIERVSLGDRVRTSRTGKWSEAGALATGDVASSRRVDLDAIDGAGSPVRVSLLRPREWLARTGARPGATILLELPEMGLRSRARVVAIGDGPDVTPGEGRTVVATIESTSRSLYELRFEGGGETLRPTARHRLYSLDRGGWVETRDLRAGERLRTATGAARIASVRAVAGAHRVYNLEVESEHEFLVAKLGVVSHNDNPCAQPSPDSESEAELFARLERENDFSDVEADADMIESLDRHVAGQMDHKVIRHSGDKNDSDRHHADDDDRDDHGVREPADVADLAALDEVTHGAIAAAPSLHGPLQQLFDDGWVVRLGDDYDYLVDEKVVILARHPGAMSTAQHLGHIAGQTSPGVRLPGVYELATRDEYIEAVTRAYVRRDTDGYVLAHRAMQEIRRQLSIHPHLPGLGDPRTYSGQSRNYRFVSAYDRYERAVAEGLDEADEHYEAMVDVVAMRAREAGSVSAYREWAATQWDSAH